MKMHRWVCIGWLWFIIGVADGFDCFSDLELWRGHLILTNRNTHG